MAEAKEQGVLFSVHLKATMMKVSDPIIFGHAVRAYFPVVFAEHADALAGAGVNANDGWARCSRRSTALPDDERAAITEAVEAAYATAPAWPWSTPTAGSPACTSPPT